MTAELSHTISRIYQEQSARVLATLIRLLGDFDLAEEATQDAFAAAVVHWPDSGIPANPRAWLISTGRFKAIDRIRRDRRFIAEVPDTTIATDPKEFVDEDLSIEDDRLRLIFTCCHPAIASDARVPLTLRTVCGLTTEEIARVFLIPLPSMAQRIVRAKAKIRAAGIPYRVPPADILPERLDAVLSVIYLVFTEGYASMADPSLVRRDLTGEAIRLGRLLVELMPAELEARGLLALMLLHDARRDARLSDDGELILLAEQDRDRWDREQIEEGAGLVEAALSGLRAGPYAIQAAIAALHVQAPTSDDTDWRQIAALYGLLLTRHPSPVVELNHAVAVAMVDGPERGLRLLDALEARGALKSYHLLFAARADLYRRLGRWAEARQEYVEALKRVTSPAERRFLDSRLETTARLQAGINNQES
ncbi:MAG: RNA polymerase sigma factor [Gemmatimonadota bacterium]